MTALQKSILEAFQIFVNGLIQGLIQTLNALTQPAPTAPPETPIADITFTGQPGMPTLNYTLNLQPTNPTDHVTSRAYSLAVTAADGTVAPVVTGTPVDQQVFVFNPGDQYALTLTDTNAVGASTPLVLSGTAEPPATVPAPPIATLVFTSVNP